MGWLGLEKGKGVVNSKSPKRKTHLNSDLKLEIDIMRTPQNNEKEADIVDELFGERPYGNTPVSDEPMLNVSQLS